MNVALTSALAGMQSQAIRLSVVANNLANVSTAGFKKSRVETQDAGYQGGGGVIVSGIDKIFSQASLISSGNQLDLSIQGDGFFQVTRSDGVVFTRDGSFSVDALGKMVNPSGYVLSPQITVPQDATNIFVVGDGTVSVTRVGLAVPQVLGQIQLVKFNNPQALESLGNNVFAQSANSGSPTTGVPGQSGLGSISQGFLETSNVDIVEEMTNMMLAQRAYEANIKVAKTSNEMFAATIDMFK
jgi:flagellar basal-body rod protein FlgG